MRYFIIFFLFYQTNLLALNQNNVNIVNPYNKIDENITEIKENIPLSRRKRSTQMPRELETKPVNNTGVIPPFPTGNKDATMWDIKLREYIYAYQIRYGNIGDKFVLPEDMDAFLKTLPHGTTDKPIVDPQKQDKIVTVFDDEYEQNIVEQYFRMQYRVMTQTIR